MDEENSPTAQGQSGEVSGDAKAAEQSGYQKRIDELTRDKYEFQRQLAEVQGRFETLSSVMAHQSQNAQAPVEAIEIDPEQKKVFDAYMGPVLKRIESGMQQLSSTLSATQLKQQLGSVDPEVAKRAEQLGSSQAFRGWAPEHLLTYAHGQVAMERNASNHAKAEIARFNGQGAPLAQGGGFNPQSLKPAEGPGPLPDNFDRLSPKKQIEILNKRGLHNKAPLSF